MFLGCITSTDPISANSWQLLQVEQVEGIFCHKERNIPKAGAQTQDLQILKSDV